MEEQFAMPWNQYMEMVDKVLEFPKVHAALVSMKSFYPATENDHILAALCASKTGKEVANELDKHSIVVTNVVDTGTSIGRYPNNPRIILISRQKVDALNRYYNSNLYIKFPWEKTDKNLEDSIRYIIGTVGGDTSKLNDLPPKLCTMFETMFDGYGKNVRPKRYVLKSNTAQTVKRRFFSVDDESCLPIYGTVHLAYFPSKHGISNPEEIIDFYTHRFTNPNTITEDICEAVNKRIKPKGIVVKVTGINVCNKFNRQDGRVNAVATKGDNRLLRKVI